MKKLCLLALLLCTCSVFAQSQQLVVGVSGNGYVTRQHDGAQITDKGIARWTNPKTVVSVYFYLHQPTKADLSLYAKGHSEIKVSYGKKSFKVSLDSDDYTQVPVGSIDVRHAGYVRIDLQGLSKRGDDFGEVKQLLADNVTGKSNYVKDFSDYWGRRGPSVHLAYTLPKGDTEWFYNEVTVPKEGETMHSYYMAAGFGEGYFGMQYNSPTERRILFSVWSPFDTQDPKEIPDDQKIKLLRQGKDVHIGEFGNEGSGGQSYLKYPWKAGHTYKFLMQVRPDGQGNTIYTAYFYATDEKEWRLIASFLRPQTSTWYRHAHSFLENFNPQQGYLSRKVLFGNQWARSKEGKWTRLIDATFTHDATAHAKVRLDYQGGNTKDNRFYLKMGGFFNESVPMGTKFHCKPTGKEPEIDWEALQKL
ncbi:MAG: DUF3472 domain-containing protein [Bacteroidaceae bacterium]|nr:DUF3472 domain-containing protein [Bacteroidaceae bacterium]